VGWRAIEMHFGVARPPEIALGKAARTTPSDLSSGRIAFATLAIFLGLRLHMRNDGNAWRDCVGLAHGTHERRGSRRELVSGFRNHRDKSNVVEPNGHSALKPIGELTHTETSLHSGIMAHPPPPQRALNDRGGAMRAPTDIW